MDLADFYDHPSRLAQPMPHFLQDNQPVSEESDALAYMRRVRGALVIPKEYDHY